MKKQKLNLRNVIAIVICIAVTTMFSGCKKSEKMTMTTEQSVVVFNISGSGTATINWGDGTKNETIKLIKGEVSTHSYGYSSTSAHTVTITGKKIVLLDCSDNQLTDLNVSNNTELIGLLCNNNQLTNLDVSNNTELNALRCNNNQLTKLDLSNNMKLTDVNEFLALNCSNNKFSDDALNALFGTLHEYIFLDSKSINITGNPGTDTCDKSIATAKGWTVDDTDVK